MEDIDSGESRINIPESEIIERYVNPYLYGEDIVINGKVIRTWDIDRIKITCSDNPLDGIVHQIEQQDKQVLGLDKLYLTTAEWRAIDTGKDVTEKYINKPKGSLKQTTKTDISKVQTEKSKKNIFVVHGHDLELKNDTEIFLKSIKLHPIVLHREIDKGLTLIEKFEKHSDVNYAIIILTPDDVGFSISELAKKEEERKMEYRSRQNVIFEFGFFIGKLGRRNVCCIYKEGVILPSDLNGLIYKKVNKSIEEVGLFLMKEFKGAGLDVKFE